MTYSLRPHGALTEPSPETMSGKGREGNKEGKGRRGLSSHHGVELRSARDRDGMMTLRARWSA